MTAEACRWKYTLRRFTNGDFFQTLDQQWVYTQEASVCYLVPGFTLVHNSIISKGVCRVFVLRCQFAALLTCLVSFHRVHLSQSSLYTHIYSFIHSYIHTFIHSCIITFIHTHHTQRHSYIVALITQKFTLSFQFGPHLSLRQAASFYK
jgi:hypothetical protein